MMKKICILFIATIFLTSCNRIAVEQPQPSAPEVTDIAESSEAATNVSAQDSDTESPIPSLGATTIIPAELQCFTQEWTTSDGYILEGTFALSPWIEYDDTELLNATWQDAVGSDCKFPSFSDSQIQYNAVVGEKSAIGSIANNIVYSVGYFELKNKTEGFDINSTAPRSVDIRLFTSSLNSVMAVVWASETIRYCPMTHIRANSAKDGYYMFGDRSSNAPALLIRQNRGKVGIVIAQCISGVSPNQPDGTPNPADVVISLYDYNSDNFTTYQDIYLPTTW